jgi:NAD(P)-dependent dehydrogenase (short-subunit alcohol dehydrogenase family)
MTGIAVVTGATGGIGRWIALGLARAGLHVVMIGRNPARIEAARSWIVQQAPEARTGSKVANLSSLEETRQVAQAILADHPAIAVLVNNAGIFRARRAVTPEGHDEVLAVNHLAPFVMANALLPALRAAGNARIVTVGSDTSDTARVDPDNLELKHGWNMVRAYSRSKLAQMMTTFTLAERLAGSGVTANVVHPGAVATGLVRSPGIIGLSWKMMAPFLLTEEQGADAPLYTALSPELAGKTGLYIKEHAPVVPNPYALDAVLRQRVWEATERLAC